MKKYILFSLLISTISTISFSQTPAFPTAEGYGKFSTGGRGGKVVFVENLDDYISYNNIETPIPGSFRWALAQYPGEPLTVIFRVSGTIKLKPYLVISGSTVKNQNDIRCSRANLTIAGQTAPGEGICFRNSKINLGGSTNLIVRNLRFRIGETAEETPIYGYTVDGVARDTLAPAGSFIPGGSVGCENATRVIFDHCVFGWSGEENLTMYDNKFTTVQWSMFHEALYNDGHGKGNRGYGGQLGGVSATYHHNLLAHNQSRSPRLNGARTDTEVRVFLEFINNVNYNWGSSAAAYGGDVNTGTLRSHTCNFLGNYYKPGPATSSSHYFFTNYIVNGANYPKWHLAENYMDGSQSATSDNWTAFTTKWSGTAGTTLPTKTELSSDTLLMPPSALIYNGSWIGYNPYKLNIESAQTAYEKVLQKVGTLNRDSVERRVIREVTNGTAMFKASLGTSGIIDKSYDAEGYLTYAPAEAPVDNDRDGMADDWEIANGLNPSDESDRNLTTAEGYTALEVYLNSLMGEMIDHDFSASGIIELNENKSSIYPTLVKNTITLNSQLPVESFSILSLNGQTIHRGKLSSGNAINASFLSAGCYMLRVEMENKIVNYFKFIKQ